MATSEKFKAAKAVVLRGARLNQRGPNDIGGYERDRPLLAAIRRARTWIELHNAAIDVGMEEYVSNARP